MSRVQLYGISQFGGESVPDSIDLSKYMISFDWEAMPCDAPAATVTSSGSWTAEWIGDGVAFSSDIYSGDDTDVLMILCNGENYLAESLTDTLRLSIGSVFVDLVVVQGAFGEGCV